MRPLKELDHIRYNTWESDFGGGPGDNTCGCFMLYSPDHNGAILRCIAATGDGWDHLSVSTKDRTPSWAEMEFVKRVFFKDTETAMQLHVPPKDHINVHDYVLHLWRPHNKKIPLPPTYMV